LIVPLNWLLHQIYLDDIQKIYGLIVGATLSALRGSHFELIPLIGSLQQWFLSLVTIPAFAPLPPIVLHFSPFPHEVVIQIGSGIHKAWNNRSGFSDFVERTMAFPVHLARAFGYQSAVPVFDHFDACGFLIDPPKRFPESEQPINLASVLCGVLETSPFFIASQDDTEFFSLFTISDYETLSTERIIPTTAGKELMIASPQFSLTADMCRGCPGYIAMYERLCEMVADATEKVAVKSQFSRLRSVVDIARNEMVKQELIRVCVLLAGADTDSLFDEDKMNELTSLKEISIKVR
jgi:hypothetical protein